MARVLQNLSEPEEIIPAPEAGTVTWSHVRLHPTRTEAVTLGNHGFPHPWSPNVLGRWDLAGPIRLLNSIRTRHAGITNLAFLPEGELIAVTPFEGPLNLRGLGDFRVRRTIADALTELQTFAVSPDGVWIALADGHEKIHLLQAATGAITDTCAGGERNYCVCFDPSSSLLATSCSYQGGSMLDICRLNKAISYWDRRAVFDRGSDELGHCAFSPDSRRIAWFESDTGSGFLRGWRGNLCLGDLDTLGEFDDDPRRLEPRWCVSIDAEVTGDNRSLMDAGYGMGFQTEVAFAGHSIVACGSTAGNLLFFNAADGSLRSRVRLGDSYDVRSMVTDESGKRVLVLTGNGPRWVPIPGSATDS